MPAAIAATAATAIIATASPAALRTATAIIAAAIPARTPGYRRHYQ